MEFKFETAYNQEAVSELAKALRKTARRRKNLRSRVFGVIVVMFAVLLTLPLGDKEFVLNFKTIFTWLVALILVLTLLFEDAINGYIARKRMLPGLEKATVTFREEGYYSETELGNSEFKYQNIVIIAETANYFVFVFGPNHGQIYKKESIEGGTLEEFREFIEKVTEKKIQYI